MFQKISIKKWKLSFWTSFFSVLCAIDCVVLPALITGVSIFGLAAPQSFYTLHQFSRWAALYIMLPLGTFTVVSNFCAHQLIWLLGTGLTGLLLVLVTHIGDCNRYEEHHHHKLENASIYEIVTFIMNKYHSVLSIAGSCLVLLSNYLSHKASHRGKAFNCRHETAHRNSESVMESTTTVKKGD